MRMPPTRTLQLEPAHHLAPLPDGSWRMTGSDPQFLVRGPFERGVWEWRFRAGLQTDAAEPAVQIYYAPNGEFSESASVRLPSLPRTPGEYRLRFWLPHRAATLRFDPADAPGALTLGDVVARREGRLASAVRAAVRQTRRGGVCALVRWLRALSAAAFDGPAAIRRTTLDLIVHDESATGADAVAGIVAARGERYPARAEPGLLALLTTVYNTPAVYLQELADSVRAQSWTEYEWIVLDNGSSDRATRRALDRLAGDPRVKLTRVDENLGILGGMRYALERATARYVLPVDSDDYLFPDTLRVMAAVIQREHYPALLYSDEDKLRDGRHVDPFRKPDWDPVLFRNCCYVAHLCAIRRDEAVRHGVYTDAAAEGCHDWDTFLRLSREGHAPIHVPEILYSWRMHGGSTAANVDAKDYVLNSQRHVLERHLDATGLRERFSVVRSPFFPASPDWWIRRARTHPTPASLVIDGRGSRSASLLPLLSTTGGYPFARIFLSGAAEQTDARATPHDASLFRTLLLAAAAAPLVVVVDAGLVPRTDEWVWEMAGLKESFGDAVMIGGRLVDAAGAIVSAGGVFAEDDTIVTSDEGRSADDPGYFGTALKQRSTGAVSLRLAALDAAWLRTIVPGPMDALEMRKLEVALAREARKGRRRIIVSPFVEALV
jgi:glycosyltransferase involved in cell wall biosynthesis